MEVSSSYLHLLTEDEKTRAERLKSKIASDQQIISRGILRLILGRYLDMKPEDLTFTTGQFGKPFLSNPVDTSINFSLTHSSNLILFAIGKRKNIGIDVEKIEEKTDLVGISSLVFSSDERLAFSISTNPLRDFYVLWTAKEAILKASGRGFSYPSNKFSVVLSKGLPSISNIPTELTGGCSCNLISFSPSTGYSAALAVMQ
ncbi:MAG: 4'-phosphopantetheinyl transferase superfamily protein [Leptolinea sp.]